VLAEVLEDAKKVAGAIRGAIFVRTADDPQLKQFLTTGEPATHGMCFMEAAVRDRQAMVFSKDDIEAFELGTRRVSKSLKDADPSSRLSVLLKDTHITADTSPTSTICCLPLLATDGSVLGVIELESRFRITPEDLKLLDCFASFASVSVQKGQLQEIADFGKVEVRLKQWIEMDERGVGPIPAKLRVQPAMADSLFRGSFDAPLWDGIGHFIALFGIFDHYSLFSEFKIPNETFFRFLEGISRTYNTVPYHNWRHAVDVTQFVSYEVSLSGLQTVLTKLELLSLLVAAICHDANHDGFTNTYNVQAETPLGILFKNQSVMETHHCSTAIRVLSKEECHIFNILSALEQKEVWNMIIKLILITDMAKHFTFLKEVNERFDHGPLFNNNPSERMMMMQLILKCADISNVSRPFELADKWCDVLCEEFFRQGDLEKTQGMEYTSPLNDRAHLDKPKSQIGFYRFVCLPLYETATRACPPLQANVDQVKANLDIWMAAADGKGG
jgi:hypothetical protein